MASVHTRTPGSKLPPPPGGRFGSPHGSSAALAGGAATPGAALQACPPTPETAGYGGGGGGGGRPRPRSTHSGSATPSDDMSASLASAATSYSSAADQLLFAPASVEDAVHAVPSLLSQMLSGRTDEQVLAARKLHAYCRAAGRPVETAVAASGGVPMLLIMLDSLDRNLRDVCTRLLTDLAADDRVRAEILATPGGTAKVIQLMYRGILDGQASAGRFLELLATSRSEAVQAALCHSKVVRMLCKTLEAAPTPRARGAALSALQAFCRQDSSNLRKLVWSDGVVALQGVLAAADTPPAQHAAALQLLASAVALQADAAAALASEAGVAALARFVGAADVPLAVQAEAAGLLVAVAGVPSKRPAAQQALTDLALPRAFEIVHEAAAAASAAEAGSMGGDGSTGAAAAASLGGDDAAAERRLQAAAAAIVAQLVEQDRECCHSILFHAQLLRPAVQMLVSGGRCGAARQLLDAARAYAASLGGGEAAPSPAPPAPALPAQPAVEAAS